MEPFAAWVERDVVHVHGDDAVSFLQGQLSQDVEPLAIGASAWSLLLEPNGKITAWLRATRVGDAEVVLDLDPGAGPLAVARLERFKLRTKVTLDLAARQPALAVRGRGGDGLPIVWPGVVGYDLLGASGAAPAGVAVVGAAAYEVARLTAGVPVTGVDLTTDTIPAEAGGWLVEASVSFSKGCYTGQELVARIDSRGGNVPRPLRRIIVPGVEVEAGAGVTTADGKVVGQLTSAVWSPVDEATVAIGPLARSVAAPGPVLVAGHEGTARP